MKFYLFFLIAVASCFCSAQAQASLITTLDFSDTSTWAVTFTDSGGVNDSTVSGGTITADKSGSLGGARVFVNLIGSISTAGFQNITIGFDGQATELEWNGNLSNVVNNTDGLLIFGDGVNINANTNNDISGTAAEGEFTAGTTFPTANFNSGFSFAASVDNGTISNLAFTLQVNAGNEELSLSNVQIFGDVIAVPEPTTFLMFGAALVGLGYRRRRS